MTDTNITLTPASAWTSGAQTVTASAALFAAADIGRLLALYQPAAQRGSASVYAVGTIFYAAYAGVERLYRVVKAGTTAAYSASGTTPSYDLNAPRETGAGVVDGSCILLYLGLGRHGWGFGTITAVADSTHATVDVDPIGPFASTTATLRWRLGEFSATRGWPRAGLFHKGRLWLFGSIARPQTAWASETGDYASFSPCEPDGTVLDTNAITETLDDDQLNTARWLVAIRKGLVLGTATGEWTMAPATTQSPLSPSNIDATRQADCGSTDEVAALRIAGVVLFPEAGGRKLRQIEYDWGSDSFVAADLTILSDHILGPGAVDMAYQRRPHGVLWLVRADGALATLTYDREQKIRAWCWHALGGLYQGGVPKVESVACVPSPDGTSDDVYVTVARTIDGATVRTVEYIRAPFRAALDGAVNAFFVDGGLSYAGAPHVTFSGLDHLEGETAWICADGSVRQNRVVTGGSVTIIGPAASVVHIGLPYLFRVTTLPPEAGAGAALGSAQGKAQRDHMITLRLLESAGGQVGRDGAAMDAIVTRTPADNLGEPVPLFSGDVRMPFPGGWDRRGEITIDHTVPLPFTLLAIIRERVTNG